MGTGSNRDAIPGSRGLMFAVAPAGSAGIPARFTEEQNVSTHGHGNRGVHLKQVDQLPSVTRGPGEVYRLKVLALLPCETLAPAPTTASP